MNQKQRLDYLVTKFREGFPKFAGVQITDYEEKQQFLRVMMNIREPLPLDPAVQKVQDEYLRARAEEKGIVDFTSIPTVKALYGSKHPFADNISIWQGDITCIRIDAIVNAANSRMRGCWQPLHTCIDNCIHTFAGVQLRLACHQQMVEKEKQFGDSYEQPTAEPMVTDGYNLPAKKVVHIVGPIISPPGVTKMQQEQLAACYTRTLDVCAAGGMRSVAFCCISTGVFSFPNKPAAAVAVAAVTDWLHKHPGKVDRVVFNVFKDEDKAIYEALFKP